MATVPSIVWIAIRVISKTGPELNRAKIVLKIRSPTPVDCRLVIRVKLAKKVILAVPNAPVVPLAKRVPVLMVLAKHVQRANLVNPMIQKRMLVHHAIRARIK